MVEIKLASIKKVIFEFSYITRGVSSSWCASALINLNKNRQFMSCGKKSDEFRQKSGLFCILCCTAFFVTRPGPPWPAVYLTVQYSWAWIGSLQHYVVCVEYQNYSTDRSQQWLLKVTLLMQGCSVKFDPYIVDPHFTAVKAAHLYSDLQLPLTLTFE